LDPPAIVNKIAVILSAPHFEDREWNVVATAFVSLHLHRAVGLCLEAPAKGALKTRRVVDELPDVMGGVPLTQKRWCQVLRDH